MTVPELGEKLSSEYSCHDKRKKIFGVKLALKMLPV